MKPTESLSIIEEMLNRSKNRFQENGFLFLMWGWLVLILNTSYTILYYWFEIQYSYAVFSFILIGYVIQYFYLKKRSSKQVAWTYTDQIVGLLWTCIAILFVYIVLIFGTVGVQIGNGLMMIAYGIGIVVTGGLLRFKPLQYGGYINFVLAFGSLFSAPFIASLLLSLSLIVSYIIPGYLLKNDPHRYA